MLFYWEREVVPSIKCRGGNNCGTHCFVKNNYVVMRDFSQNKFTSI